MKTRVRSRWFTTPEPELQEQMEVSSCSHIWFCFCFPTPGIYNSGARLSLVRFSNWLESLRSVGWGTWLGWSWHQNCKEEAEVWVLARQISLADDRRSLIGRDLNTQLTFWNTAAFSQKCFHCWLIVLIIIWLIMFRMAIVLFAERWTKTSLGRFDGSWFKLVQPFYFLLSVFFCFWWNSLIS